MSMGMNSDFEPISPPSDKDLPELVFGSEADLVASEELVWQDVEVTTEKAEGRQRHISAKIYIPHAADRIWQILTDYDRLAEFIPNLTKSQRIDHPQGGIRIEQIGAESLLKLQFCARVVLDMVEHFPHRLDFTMVEGDFKLFKGSWTLQPLAENGTELVYQLSVLPHRLMPIAVIERRLKSGMVLNLSAIRQRADQLALT
jgi:ribosome-associated toxin RatA of RatAB toxin-antitoxin module